MLVAVGLVVLMMTLFATIFQIATSAMSTQKGLAENDQRVRLVMNRLRNDLNGIKNDANDPGRPYRTFRNLIPFAANETALPNFNPTDRNGYFYISENNPDDDTDDVLALTVQYPSTASDQFFGQAAIVFPDTTAGASYGPGNSGPNNPNPGKRVTRRRDQRQCRSRRLLPLERHIGRTNRTLTTFSVFRTEPVTLRSRKCATSSAKGPFIAACC